MDTEGSHHIAIFRNINWSNSICTYFFLLISTSDWLKKFVLNSILGDLGLCVHTEIPLQ